MRAKYTMVALCVLFTLPASCAGFRIGSALESEAIRSIARQVAEAMPEQTGIKHLAVFPIEGDESEEIYSTLIAEINKKKRYTPIERQRLDKIFEEYGWQKKDIIERRVKLGMIKGVEGVLFGKVLERDTKTFKSRVRVRITFDKAQSGDILLEDIFEAEAVFKYAKEVALAAVVIAFWGVVVVLVVRRFRGRGARIDGKASHVRRETAGRMGGVMSQIRAVKTDLSSSDRQEAALAIADLEKELRVLRQHIEMGGQRKDLPSGGAGSKRVYKEDSKMKDSVSSIIEEAEELLKKVQSAGDEEIKEMAGALRQHVIGAAASYR